MDLNSKASRPLKRTEVKEWNLKEITQLEIMKRTKKRRCCYCKACLNIYQFINLKSIKTIHQKMQNLPGPYAHGNVCAVAAIALRGRCPVAARRHRAGKKPMAPRHCHVVRNGFLDRVRPVRCFEVVFV